MQPTQEEHRVERLPHGPCHLPSCVLAGAPHHRAEDRSIAGKAHFSKHLQGSQCHKCPHSPRSHDRADRVAQSCEAAGGLSVAGQGHTGLCPTGALPSHFWETAVGVWWLQARILLQSQAGPCAGRPEGRLHFNLLLLGVTEMQLDTYNFFYLLVRLLPVSYQRPACPGHHDSCRPFLE